jgi:Zn-finger protein
MKSLMKKGIYIRDLLTTNYAHYNYILMLPKKRKCDNIPHRKINYIVNFQCPLWKHSNGSTHRYHLDQSDGQQIYLCSDCYKAKSDTYDEYIAKRKKLNAVTDNIELESDDLDQKQIDIVIRKSEKLNRKYNLSSSETLYSQTIKDPSSSIKRECVSPEEDIVIVGDEHDRAFVYAEIDKHIHQYIKDNDIITHAVDMFWLTNSRSFKISKNNIYILSDRNQYVLVANKKSSYAFNVITHELFILLRMDRKCKFDQGRSELHADTHQKVQRSIDDKYYKKTIHHREQQIINETNHYLEFINAMNHNKYDILDAIYVSIPCSVTN